MFFVFSKEPDVVWTGIGKKIPVIVFYASLLDIDIKERQLLTGKNFSSFYVCCVYVNI